MSKKRTLKDGSGSKVGSLVSGFLARLNVGNQQDSSARELMLEGEAQVRASMRQLRKRLRKTSAGYGGGSVGRVGRNRSYRAKARALLKAYRKAFTANRRFALEVELLDAKFHESPVLDGLLPTRRKNWKSPLQRSFSAFPKAIDLEKFTFIDNPVGTLQSFKAIALIEGQERTARLNFKDQFCDDAGAYLVLAEVWPHMTRIFQGGEMSVPVQRVLNATGVSEHNRMRTLATENARDREQRQKSSIWAYPLQRRRPAGSSSSMTQHLDQQAREKAADRFSTWTNTCLGESAELELTQEGKANIANIMGEVLCNAERHSRSDSDDGDWSVTAFMVRREAEGGEAYRCMIAFLSVGQSIAESLASAATDIRQRESEYLARHWQSGRSPTTLSTVFAMQDTITCDPAAREGRSGGTGLQDILDFVGVLGATDDMSAGPKVTIVSGKSCIQLKHPYIQGAREGGVGTKPRLLWFNPANSADLPPDEAFVFDLEDHFAGTLVTIAFNLDAAFLRRQVETDDGSD